MKLHAIVLLSSSALLLSTSDCDAQRQALASRRPSKITPQQFSRPGDPFPSNIVVLLLDDVGYLDLTQVSTPNIDALAAGGLTFTRAYAHPWCKPTRDSMLLGRYEGMVRGDSCAPVDETSFGAGTPTFLGSLQGAGFQTANVGKWHLGRSAADGLPWWYAASAWGYDFWREGVSSAAIGAGCNPSGLAHDDGVFKPANMYETLRQRDAMLALIDEAALAGKPLFTMLSFTDAHSPWNLPPRSLLPVGYTPPASPTDRDLFEAEIMGLDTAIGQIMDALPPDSWIILTGDNGTPTTVTKPPTLLAKGKVFERGVHVPLILYGPGIIPGSIRDDVVHLSGLARTILDSLGLEGPGRDGRNILDAPIPHQFVYVRNPTGNARAIIEKDYKLIEDNGVLLFFSLALDPGETLPLPHFGPDFDRLLERLELLPPAS